MNKYIRTTRLTAVPFHHDYIMKKVHKYFQDSNSKSLISGKATRFEIVMPEK